MEANDVQPVPPVPPSNAGLVPCMIVPEVLKKGNYKRWRIFMQHYLVAQDLWNVVLSSEMPKEDSRDWVRKNALALHAIKISCGVESFDQIEEMNSAKDVWNALADLHKQPNEDASRGSENKTVKETCARILENNQRTKIVSSLRNGNWDALKDLDRITEILFPGGFTVLHIATIAGHLKIVKELVKTTGAEYLEIQDDNGDTALSLAACEGKVKIAECLAQENEKLLTTLNKKGYIPLVVACVNRQKDMASYLYSITELEFLLPENSNQGALFLKYCALNFMLDVSLDLFLRCPRLAVGTESITISELFAQRSLLFNATDFLLIDYLLYLCLNVVKLPSPSDDAVSKTRLQTFKIQVEWVKVMDRILGLFLFPFAGTVKLERLYNKKLTHKYAKLVLRHWCRQISTYSNTTQLVASGAISAILEASKHEADEIVIEILKANPDLIWCNNDQFARDLITSAIKHRQGAILTFGYSLDAGKKALLSLTDEDGNNALHLAAKLPECRYDFVGIHAAWTMSLEEMWFEEIKSYLPYWCHEAKNHYGETPDQVFNSEHHKLITEIEKWAKKTAESYSLASVLIVTIMFAALFTLPAGNDEKTGMPKLLHIKQFFRFLVCDAVSFITASTSLLGFLNVLTVTYERRGPRRALPFQMLFAISTLIISVATMILAFMFALAMMLENKWQVLPAIVVYLLVVSVVMFSDWQVPTLRRLFVMMVFWYKQLVRDGP